MDGDRKYRQHGYQDSDRPSNGYRPDRPKQSGPRLPLDITGPKLPRLVQNVVASRCYNCSMALASNADFKGTCPKCGVALHCCKQCVHFDSSTRFQCLKPVPARIAAKDQLNACELFSPRVTVARDGAPSGPPAPSRTQSGAAAAMTAPRNVTDARAAFDSLFKK